MGHVIMHACKSRALNNVAKHVMVQHENNAICTIPTGDGPFGGPRPSLANGGEMMSFKQAGSFKGI